MTDPVRSRDDLEAAVPSWAVAAVATQFWINGMTYSSIVPRLPEIRERIDVSTAGLGLILTLTALGGLVGSVIASPLVNRLGTRNTILASTLAVLVVLPVAGLTTSAVVFVLVVISLNLFDVPADVAMNIQGSWLSDRRATPIMNRLHGMWSLGTVTGGLTATWAAATGVSLTRHLLAVVAVLLAAVLVSRQGLVPADRIMDRSSSTAADDDGDGSIGSELTRRVAVLFVVLAIAAIVMEQITADWAAFRLADDLGAGPGLAGLGFVAFTLGMVTGRFAGDAIQARVGTRLLVRAASALAAFGLIVATLGPGGTGGRVVALVGFYIAALGVAVVFPQLYDAAAKAPGRPGQALGILTGGIRIGHLGAPVVVGLLAEAGLSIGAAVAIVTIPACIVSLLVRPPVDEDPSSNAVRSGSTDQS